jgi:ADP-heptose:LPS heptosyltransferase
MPVVNALRDRFPDAFIAWLAEKPAARLLEGHPAIDELIAVPHGWLKSPRLVWGVRRRLRQIRFDIAIDPQSLTKSAIPAWLSGAKTRIGFAAPFGREAAPWLNNHLVEKTSSHVVDIMLQTLEPLGIESPDVRFRVPVGTDSERMCDEFLCERGLVDGFVVINPGAGWQSRLWPVDRYAALARYLRERWSLPSVVTWAGEQEKMWAEEIVERSAGSVQPAPKTSLKDLAAILRRARLFVGSDTGPMHLAVAVDTQCVSLHGTTPAWQSGPYGEGHIAIQEVHQEGTCRNRRTTDNEAMRKITVERVTDACDEILGRRRVDRVA